MNISVPVVIASDVRPIRSGGGPAGIAYRLLNNLLNNNEICLSFLSFTEGKIWKVIDSSLLENISLEMYPNVSNNGFQYYLKKLVKKIPLLREFYWSYKYGMIRKKIIKNLNMSLDFGGILHLHGISPSIPDEIFEMEGVSVIWTEHSKGGVLREKEQMEGSKIKNWGLYRTLYEKYLLMINCCNQIVFPSYGAVKLFEDYMEVEIPREKLSIVYNGIKDPMFLYGIKPIIERGLFFTVAEHVPEKGLDITLEGLSRLKRPWRWFIVGGETPWTRHLLAKAKSLRVLSRVELLGRRTHRETLELMSRAEAVIFTQRVAVFDLALLEAMALSKTVLATPVGGNVEALGDDYSFYVTNPEELGNALEKLSSDVLVEIGNRNREKYLKKFTEKVMVAKYYELYRKFMRKTVY